LKIFIAGSISDIKPIKELSEIYEMASDVITRKWWDELDKPKKISMRENIEAIEECELFVFYNGNEKTSGKYVELGVAIALNKNITFFGEKLTTIYSNCKELKKPNNFVFYSEYFDESNFVHNIGTAFRSYKKCYEKAMNFNGEVKITSKFEEMIESMFPLGMYWVEVKNNNKISKYKIIIRGIRLE